MLWWQGGAGRWTWFWRRRWRCGQSWAMAAVRGEGGEGGGDCSGRQSVGYGQGEGCEAAAMQPCRGLHVSMHILSNQRAITQLLKQVA